MKRNIVKKGILRILLCMILTVIPTMFVYAESGYYDSTYSMTGGVYSHRNWDTDATPTFNVANSNCYSEYEGNIYVMLQKSAALGWSTKDDATLNSRSSGSCDFHGNGAGKGS